MIILLFCSFFAQSQERPKLVVGIVVDQMRYDYIYRFWDAFGENGFKELVNEGAFYRNTHFSYMPTYTGPGHASIFTGTTPAVHGIIGNNWYDKESQKSVYCAGDGEMHTVCNQKIIPQMSLPTMDKCRHTECLQQQLAMSYNSLMIMPK